MSLDMIEQTAKAIIETAYKYEKQQGKEKEKTKMYLLALAETIKKNVEEEKNATK